MQLHAECTHLNCILTCVLLHDLQFNELLAGCVSLAWIHMYNAIDFPHCLTHCKYLCIM